MNKISKNLLEKINTIPAQPGVYKMLDLNGRIIYIGKSISLRNRVKSYFVKKPKWSKVEKMVSFINDIEYIVTDTHLEAVLLECELIKKIKPMFNTQLKNDERYAYIKVEDYNIHKSLSMISKREENSFGPFRRKFFLLELLNSLKNIYPIVKTHEGYDFQYNLIPITMNRKLFEENKNSLQEIFLYDKSMVLFINRLEDKMKEAASELQYVTASIYRDMIYGFNYLKTGLYGYKTMFFKDILLKMPIDTGYKLFFVSKGEILSKSTFPVLKEKDVENFINAGKNLSLSNSLDRNEKANIDFRDILYSEINSLPEEMVIYL